MNRESREAWAALLHGELTGDIIPFWLAHAFEGEDGGIIGRMSRDRVKDETAPRGLILVARVLWSFAAFARHLDDDRLCRAAADRAFSYLDAYFWDQDHGGAFWTVDRGGQPHDDRKKTYGQAFVIYALAEYHRASGSPRALAQARKLFELVESKAHDPRFGGYFEAYERNWTPAADLRLGEDDLNAKKSMNTHLHVLEAYTGLLRSWPDARLRERMIELVELFLRRIIDPGTSRFHAFFEDDWSVRGTHSSPGHDIEGSWLLCEAAEAIGDTRLLARVRERALAMASAVLRDGVDADGGVYNGTTHDGIADYDKSWWPQAEAVVGFLNAYELSAQADYMNAARGAFSFIQTYILDTEYGEWFWSVSRSGQPDLSKPKISEWKCPYHNGRMCVEALGRLRRLEGGASLLSGG